MYKVISKTYLNTAYLEITKNSQNGFVISIPTDPDNTDYQAYLKWLEEGNTPTPADEGAE